MFASLVDFPGSAVGRHGRRSRLRRVLRALLMLLGCLILTVGPVLVYILRFQQRVYWSQARVP